MSIFAALLFTVATAPALQGWGSAELLDSVSGVATNSGFGAELVAAGDVDGDGFHEFVTTSFLGGWWYNTRYELRDGRTGALHYAGSGQYPFACDDLDGDGIEDFGYLVPGQAAPTVYLVSATNGAPLRVITLPSASERLGSVASCADRDGDGIGDVLVASVDDQWMNPTVHYISSATGLALQSFVGVCQEPVYGGATNCRAIPFDDADGDGVEDFVFASTTEDWLGIQQAGVVYVRSGATGQLLDVFGGWEYIQRMGQRLLPVGDLDGDAMPELLVVSQSTTPDGIFPVRSVARGIELYRVQLSAWGTYDYPDASPAGDVDGDGMRDFLVGTSLLSGVDGSVLVEIPDPSPQSAGMFGRFVLRTEHPLHPTSFLISAPSEGPGRVYSIAVEPGIRADRRVVHALNPVPVEFDLRFPADQVGNPYRVLASLAPAGTTSAVGGFTLPLGASPLLDRAMGAAPLPWLQGGHGFVPWPARASATAALPAASLLPAIGVTIRFAVVTHPAGAVSWSSVSVPVTVLP